MARHCLTHTTGGSQLASRRQRPRGDCSGSGPLWRVLGMSRLTKAIGVMICAGDRRQTAESAAQRLRTCGWWQPINRDERDATTRPQTASHAHSGVSTRQIVAVTGWLRSPCNGPPDTRWSAQGNRALLQGHLGNSKPWRARRDCASSALGHFSPSDQLSLEAVHGCDLTTRTPDSAGHRPPNPARAVKNNHLAPSASGRVPPAHPTQRQRRRLARTPHRRMAHSAPRGVTRSTSPLEGVAAGLDPMARSARCRGCRPLLPELPPHRSRTR